jgi:hypothetical protein
MTADDLAKIAWLFFVLGGVCVIALTICFATTPTASISLDPLLPKPSPRRPLPKGIRRRVNVIAADWGVAYERDDGAPGLYAEMRGGWTADELRAIADDLDVRAELKAKA